MRHLVIAMAGLALLAGEGRDGAAQAVPRGERHVRAAAIHVARRLEYSRRPHPRAGAGVGRASADARADAARRQCVRRHHASRLHRLEGVLRKPAGFFVAGNLYRPIGEGPFPAILSPHGHWAYGRLENSATASVPGRAINLARQGFVVFTYDMIGYNDSPQLEHQSSAGRAKSCGA